MIQFDIRKLDEPLPLNRTERKLVQAIAYPIAFILFIIFCILKIIAKILFKIKRWLFRISIFLFVFYLASTQLTFRVNTPEVHAISSMPITPTPTQEQVIDNEIKQVFGIYYPKAELLLKGNGLAGACHENAGLNPLAVNRNWIDGQPGQYSSSDYGIFQINDHWQGVSNVAFLTDYHINIRMAWNIFKRSGYNFKMWTCGKYYNI